LGSRHGATPRRIDAVQRQDGDFNEQGEPMVRSRRTPNTRLATTLSWALAAAVASAAPAAAQTPSPAPNTITVTGTAQVKPEPVDAKSNESIKQAVATARRRAVPLAINNGRGRAATLSQLAGIPLGKLIAIAEGPASPFGPFGPFGEEGTFGPGLYCGTVRSRIFKTDSQGRRRAVGTRSRKQCRVPRSVTANLTMVFSTA